MNMRTNALGFKAITVRYIDVNEKKEKEITAETIELTRTKDDDKKVSIELQDKFWDVIETKYANINHPITATKITDPAKGGLYSHMEVNDGITLNIDPTEIKNPTNHVTIFMHGDAKVNAYSPSNLVFDHPCGVSKNSKLTIGGKINNMELRHGFNSDNVEMVRTSA